MFEKLMIALALSGLGSNPTLCSIEGGDGGAGGGGGDGGSGGGAPPPKTFTQDELNRIAAREKQQGIEAGRKAAEEAAKAELAARDARIAELELAGKTEAEKREIERKQREEADRKAREARETALAKERDDAKAAESTWKSRWKGDRESAQVTSSLVAGKVVATAVTDAVEAFKRAAKIESDEEGQITSVIYGGKSFTKLDEAAAEFLKDKPHFAQASGTGGAGTRSGSNGGAGHGTKPLWQMSDEELKELDRAQSAAGK